MVSRAEARALMIAVDDVEKCLELDKGIDLSVQLKDPSSETHRSGTAGKDIFKVKEVIEIPQSLSMEIGGRMDAEDYELQLMGIFPEIHYIWLTLDSRLYLFDYGGKSSKYVEYTELNQVIVSVALVIPKADVFVEDVEYLLIIATAVEIIILAVMFEENREISLVPTQLSTPSDNICMLDIVGTEYGRVFLCGKDGNLYELEYKAKSGWLKNNCYKINYTKSLLSSCVPSFLKLGEDPIIEAAIDHERNLLYTLSERSKIQMFDLGENGQKMVQVACINDIRSACMNMWFDEQEKNMFEVVSLAIVPLAESSVIHLIGITERGIRLYFSTVPRCYRRNLAEELKSTEKVFRESGPSVLELLHIRVPPPRNEKDRRNILAEYSGMHTLAHSQGLSIMADGSQKDGKLLLLCTATTVPPNQHELRENVSFIQLESNIAWAIVNAVPERNVFYCGNELATQHAIPAPSVLCLTQEGIHRIVKLRPVDELYELLQTYQSGNASPVEKFMLEYGGEGCAMCLHIICSQPHLQLPLDDSVTQILPIEGRQSKEVVRNAEEVFSVYGISNSFSDAFSSRTPMDRSYNHSSMDNTSSMKYQAITKFISRVLSPLWLAGTVFSLHENLKTLSFLKKNRDDLISCRIQPRLTRNQLEQIQQILLRLDHFCNRTSSSLLQNTSSTKPSGPGRQEVATLRNIFSLTKRAVEAISFIELLCFPINEDMGSINMLDIPSERLADVKKLTFKDFLSGASEETTNTLLKSVMKLYSEKQQSIEVISTRLHAQCKSFFPMANLTLHKVLRQLQAIALEPHGPYVESVCKESCEMMVPIAGEVCIEEILEMFGVHSYFTGFVRLALERAKQLKLIVLKVGNEAGAEEVKKEQIICYRNILSLYSKQKDALAKRVIQKAVFQSSNDKICHWEFFMWFKEKIDLKTLQPRELLEIHSPYLEEFLQNKDKELLYLYYCTHGRHGEAAQVASELAEKCFSIHKRIQWLVDTIGNAKACGGGKSSGVEVHEVSEKLEVAVIQSGIYEQIENNSTIDAKKKKQALAYLDASLLDITTLFNQFAAPLKLWESQLSMFHCSGHTDTRRVHECWNNIIVDSKDLKALQHKVFNLGKQFHPSEWAFPVDFLCERLEMENRNIHSLFDPSFFWVIETMASIGVSFEILFDIYTKNLLKKQIQLEILLPLIHLIDRWIHDESSNESRQYTGKRVMLFVDESLRSISSPEDGVVEENRKEVEERLSLLHESLTKFTSQNSDSSYFGDY